MQDVDPYLEAQLETFLDLPIVGDVRGSHLMMSLEFVSDKAEQPSFGLGVAIRKHIATHAYQNGLIARNVGDYIILSPPLILDRENIYTLINPLRGAIEATLTDLTTEKIWQHS